MIKTCSFILGITLASQSFAIEWPDQKLLVAVPTITTTKKTKTTNQNYSLPVGFAAEYSMFLEGYLSLFAQFETNLELSKQSAVYLGGGGGLTWYFLGGSNNAHKDTFSALKVRPKLNGFLGGGFAARQYDYSAVEPEIEEGVGFTRDAQDKQKGSAFGIMLLTGVEYPINFNLVPGLRAQIVQTFGGKSEPAISIVEIWLSLGFLMM